MMYRSKSIMGENEVRVFKETNKIDRKIIQIIIDNFCVKLVEIQSLAVFGAMLYNRMPSSVRKYSGNSLSGFKIPLDQFLENILD